MPAEKILKIIGASPTKHNMFDPAPALLIMNMCNMSPEGGIFPNSLNAMTKEDKP